jgi:LemA protein
VSSISLLRGTNQLATLLQMGTAFITLLGFGGGLGLMTLFAIGKYNSLVLLRNRYKNGFAQLDLHLRRRHDLIATLAEILATAGECDKMKMIILARDCAHTAGAKAAANPGDARAMRELSREETNFNSALTRLFAVAESYAGLKSNKMMPQLFQELTATENRISLSRKTYNDAVLAYNTQRRLFPARMIAELLHFDEAELFVIEDPAEKLTPAVSST